jgi:hypothetical protein
VKHNICAVGFAASLLFFASPACTQTLTPEQKQTIAGLKDDLKRIQQEIDQAVQEDAKYSGGLIKALIGVRVEILKTNAALVEQRIHTLEGGARQSVVVNVTKPDPTRADELVSEIAAQEKKVAEARREADRYTGGLAKALSESTVATARNSLAMLEQQYFIAKYGLAMPATSQGSPEAAKTPTTAAPRSTMPPSAPTGSRAGGCLKIETFGSSVLSSNDVYTELAWKVDVLNSCAEPFGVRVTFTIFDKDEFQLDSGSEEVFVSANGTGKARGKMLVSPPEKARRMARQGASLSAR